MKKLLFIAILLMPVFLYAQAEKTGYGEEMSFYLGAGTVIPNIPIPDGVDITPKPGLAFGINYLHYYKERYALGLEFFSQQGDYNVNNKDKALGGTYYNFNLSNKYVFSSLDNKKIRGYIPFGVGFGSVEIRKDLPLPMVGKEKTKSSGFTWFFGLGADYHINEKYLFGLEARMAQNFFNKSTAKTKENYFWSASLVAKFGIKF